MAKFEGFSARQLPKVKEMYKSARLALEEAVGDFDSANFRNLFQKWMGNAGGLNAVKSGEKALQGIIKAMNARIATLAFTVSYNPNLADNAEMQHPHRAGALAGNPSVQNVLDATDSLRMQFGNIIQMVLGPAVFKMPFAEAGVQSQVETFLHELSHHAAMTVDDTVGGECYGKTGVLRLKALGPARSVYNAENVGFFLVEYALNADPIGLAALNLG